MPEIVNPPELARAVGFSHGVVAAGGRWLFLAGQTATDGAGQTVAAGDVVGQYEQVLRNLQAVVTAAGGTMAHIVKLTSTGAVGGRSPAPSACLCARSSTPPLFVGEGVGGCGRRALPSPICLPLRSVVKHPLSS